LEVNKTRDTGRKRIIGRDVFEGKPLLTGLRTGKEFVKNVAVWSGVMTGTDDALVLVRDEIIESGGEQSGL
jgi:hypothetical protein